MTSLPRSVPPASLFLWRGRALVIGPGIDSRPHAHFAMQATFGLERPFRVRLTPGTPWTETPAAVFAPNQAHELDCGGDMLAHLFVELPLRQPADLTCLTASFHASREFAAVRARLDAARRGALGLDDAERLLRDWLDCVWPRQEAPAAYDSRIVRALDWIERHPEARPSGAALAAGVHLSATRFTHLFRQQTGLPLSRFLLWNRLLRAVEAVAGGDNMTDAAHRAGFADLAHMSRTFRRTFGVVPSELHRMTIAFKREAGGPAILNEKAVPASARRPS